MWGLACGVTCLVLSNMSQLLRAREWGRGTLICIFAPPKKGQAAGAELQAPQLALSQRNVLSNKRPLRSIRAAQETASAETLVPTGRDLRGHDRSKEGLPG